MTTRRASRLVWWVAGLTALATIAGATLAAFSMRLRDKVDLGAVVHETKQPEHVSLGLRAEQAGE